MPENLIDLIGPIALILFWVLWTFFSETRYNHGIWVAFLLPLAPLYFIIGFFLFQLIKLLLYPIYWLINKRDTYEIVKRKIGFWLMQSMD